MGKLRQEAPRASARGRTVKQQPSLPASHATAPVPLPAGQLWYLRLAEETRERWAGAATELVSDARVRLSPEDSQERTLWYYLNVQAVTRLRWRGHLGGSRVKAPK